MSSCTDGCLCPLFGCALSLSFWRSLKFVFTQPPLALAEDLLCKQNPSNSLPIVTSPACFPIRKAKLKEIRPLPWRARENPKKNCSEIWRKTVLVEHQTPRLIYVQKNNPKNCMPTLIAQTLLLISQIRSFEKSIKFSSYFLQNENYMEIFLYFSISKLQTCNWTVTTEEQISPVVNFDQTKFLQQISKIT